MFRALLARIQEVLHKQQLVYCVRVMSASYHQGWSGTSFTPVVLYAAPPEDEQVELETCREC
jgi:hypothetical protein